MPRIVVVTLLVAYSACVRVDSGAYLCDAHGACPSGFACVNDRCVTSSSSEGEGEGAIGEGEGEGSIGEGEGAIGEGEGEGSASAFTSLDLPNVDDTIEDIALVDVNGTAHIAVWSRTNSPVVERLHDVTCTGTCTSANNWHDAIVDDNIPVTAPLHPDVGVDASGHAIISYVRAGSVSAAVCNGDCVQSSSWSLTTIALNTKSPRITPDASTVFSCSTLTGNALVESRCTSACDQQASWSSTTLDAACDDVTSVASDGARFDVAFTRLNASSIAECTNNCASSSSWSSPVSSGEGARNTLCRLIPGGPVALFDVTTAKLSACDPCSSAPAPIASIDNTDGVAASLTIGADASIHVVASNANGWADHACDALSSCTLGQIVVTSSTKHASFLASAVDANGHVVVAAANGNALTWFVANN